MEIIIEAWRLDNYHWVVCPFWQAISLQIDMERRWEWVLKEKIREAK